MTAVYQSGLRVDPTQYKQSGVWDTDWGKAAYGAKPYEGYNQRVGQYADRMMSGADPTAGGYGGFQSSLNLGGYPDINNQGTVSTLGKWNSYLQGGARNYMDQNARNYANQSAATSRFGPAGGAGAGAQAQAGVNQSLASMFGQNVAQGMGYMKDKASYDQSSANSYLDYLKAKLGTGVSLLGLEKSGLDSGTGYATQMFNARRGDYGSDIGTQQQWALQAPQLAEQEAARQRAAQDRGAGQNQSLYNSNMLSYATSPSTYTSGSYGNPFMQSYLAQLQATGAMPYGKSAAPVESRTPTTGVNTGGTWGGYQQGTNPYLPLGYS